MTEYFNNCNSCCEGNLSVPPFDNYQCPQCDEENKPCETCGPQRPKWPCNCCEKDIMCAAQACCRPCWDTCKCMDEILGMKKCADKVKRELNNVNGRVTKVEKDIIEFNDNLSEAIGDLAEKEERDIVDVRNSIGAAVAVVQLTVNDEKDRAIAKENAILNNLDQYIAYNDAELAAEIAARIAGDETEKADRIAADDAEKNARIASDTEERDARIAGDNTLDYKINQLDQRLTTDLNNEIRRSTNKDNSLQDQLDAETQDRVRAISNEVQDRIAADSLLLQNITNETNSRVEEDEAIRQLIGQVQASLINYYTKGDTYNKTEVNQILENIRRFQYKVVAQLPTASDDTVGYIYLVPSPNPVTQNVKDEYITVLNTDGDPSNYYRWEQIGSTTVDLSPYSTTAQMNQAIQSAVSAEQARAVQKEGELLSAINSEKSRAQGAEQTLQNSINAEAQARLQTDNALQANIDGEQSARQSADNALDGKIEDEKTRAQGVEQGLLNSLNNAISGVSINGNTLTFTRINGTSFTIDIPGLWKVVGGTLTPIDETKSVTAAGFYDNTL